jgi:hypothetical protein
MGRVNAVRLWVHRQPEWIAGPFERTSPMPVHGRTACRQAGRHGQTVPARSLRCARLRLRFARGPVLEALDGDVPFMDSGRWW